MSTTLPTDAAPIVAASLASDASDPHPTFGGLADVKGSATIGKLVAALAKAQGAMRAALKDAKNAHFGSTYATLAAVVDAARPLAAHNLALMQWPSVTGQRVIVTTLLSHESGEWLAGSCEATVGQATPQAIGSCLTYLRRYSALAVLNLAPDDDDGELAEAGHRHAKDTSSSRTEAPPPRPATPARAPKAPDADPPVGFITVPQQRRLFAIAKSRGWSEPVLKDFLEGKGFASSKNISYAAYDGICAELDRGPVPADDSPS